MKERSVNYKAKSYVNTAPMLTYTYKSR